MCTHRHIAKSCIYLYDTMYWYAMDCSKKFNYRKFISRNLSGFSTSSSEMKGRVCRNIDMLITSAPVYATTLMSNSCVLYRKFPFKLVVNKNDRLTSSFYFNPKKLNLSLRNHTDTPSNPHQIHFCPQILE